MLDYAPHLAQGAGPASCLAGASGASWAVDIGAHGLPADETLLVSLVASVKSAPPATRAVPPQPPLRGPYQFHPERASGYCAAG